MNEVCMRLSAGYIYSNIEHNEIFAVCRKTDGKTDAIALGVDRTYQGDKNQICHVVCRMRCAAVRLRVLVLFFKCDGTELN